MSRPVGLTQDAGFEIGVSRTIDTAPARVWAVVVGDEGIRTWLGAGVRFPAGGPAPGTGYETVDGTRGEIRSFHSSGRLRLTWQPVDWDHPSTVQVTVSERNGKAVLRFHQERLADPDERERQRVHWRCVLDDLAGLLD